MTEDGKQKAPTLEGDKALELWREGADVWNSWIEEHPGWNISFAGVDFASERDSEGRLSFSGYHFGDGHVSFSNAIFGGGNVDFSWATHGEGYVLFHLTTFGDGKLDFFSATLGRLNFQDTTFAKIKIDFTLAKLKELIFNPAAMDSSHIKARNISVKIRATFVFDRFADNLDSFDLQGASFDGPLTIAGNMRNVPDLRATRYTHQVDLSVLKVKLRRTHQAIKSFKRFSAKAEHLEDAARLRRLKEIAETNKDHQAALRFSADENRARRWIETSWFGSVLDMAFSACSNYGQSILRPFVALFVLAVASMGLYKKLAVTTEIAWWTGPGWGQSLLLSISNSLPFLPQSRGLREDALKALYPGDPSLWVDALMIGQGVLSFAFLFLIGLGLRNRFRL